MDGVMALIGEARAAGIAWCLDGEALKVTVPPGAHGVLDRLRAAREAVEIIVRAELMFDGMAMATGWLTVRTFATERAAHAWADGFAYARRVCRLGPLTVARLAHESGWGVFNPDYPADAYVFDDRGRIARRA